MFTILLGAVKAFFEAIPFFSRWFTKTPTQKVEERQATTAEEIEKAKKTGRPTWK